MHRVRMECSVVLGGGGGGGGGLGGIFKTNFKPFLNKLIVCFHMILSQGCFCLVNICRVLAGWPGGMYAHSPFNCQPGFES